MKSASEIEFIPAAGGFYMIDRKRDECGYFTSLSESIHHPHFGEFGPTGRSPSARWIFWTVAIPAVALMYWQGAIALFS